jgi:hypothetical protein
VSDVGNDWLVYCNFFFLAMVYIVARWQKIGEQNVLCRDFLVAFGRRVVGRCNGQYPCIWTLLIVFWNIFFYA